LDNGSIMPSGPVYFTVRNTGNIMENILVKGTDAQSMPGEPVTIWFLDEFTRGLDRYQLEIMPDAVFLSTTNKNMWTLDPGNERPFTLTIYTPNAITTPARMWARIKLTAIAAIPPV